MYDNEIDIAKVIYQIKNIKKFKILSLEKARSKVECMCSVCSKSTTKPIYIFKRIGLKWCKHCNEKNQYIAMRFSKIETINMINSRKNYTFVNWVGGDFVSYTKSKATVKCQTCNNVFVTNMGNFLNKRKNCPYCSKKGFNNKNPAYFYVFKIKYKNMEFLKYGITNDIDKRLYNQKLKSKCEHELIFKMHFEIGGDARKIESYITKHLKPKNFKIDSNILPDGYTETLPILFFEKVKYDVVNFSKIHKC